MLFIYTVIGLLRSKNPTELIGQDDEVMVYFTTIPDLASLEKTDKKTEDFKFIDWAIAEKINDAKS